jgi:hypothetical protein
MADSPQIKHARKMDDKRRITLPEDLPSGATVVLQPVEKGVWLVYELTPSVRHFVEADSGPVI